MNFLAKCLDYFDWFGALTFLRSPAAIALRMGYPQTVRRLRIYLAMAADDSTTTATLVRHHGCQIERDIGHWVQNGFLQPRGEDALEPTGKPVSAWLWESMLCEWRSHAN